MDESRKEITSLNRRSFISLIIMLSSLAASYSLAALYSLRFLHPGRRKKHLARMFITYTDKLGPGQSKEFITPSGENYLLTNTGDPQNPYQAFSSICPHLGCNVFWDSQENQYICPCHQGVFSSDGIALAGPPAKAGQVLKPCSLVVKGAAIYAEVETA